jgi:hypothetical protein
MSGNIAAIASIFNTAPNLELRTMSSPTESRKGYTQAQVTQYEDVELAELSEGEKKKLLRRIDRIVLPQLVVCYTFFYIDKTTSSYAKLFGIEQDLGLVDKEYSWLSSIFYFGFLVWASMLFLLVRWL